VYEINTWVWLSELSQKYGRKIELGSVPAAEWDAISAGLDAIWLMGVWERSAAGIGIANQNQGLLRDFQSALPDFSPPDNVGSPYCVRRYEVDQHLGGPKGLKIARRELSRRGTKLILDFVPNHVAPDHPWAAEHPEDFIRGTADEGANDPSAFIRIGQTVYACGRDPYFPAWPDVLQLNAFEPDLRKRVVETVESMAQQCDGVRCDMAMLVLNDIFERTWGRRAGARPATEYWHDVISAVKKHHPEFLFIAEAYWDLEWTLQQQGFDFCYDKKLYDRLEHGSVESIRLHLCADALYQDKILRFIENHDEPRASATFPTAKEKAAALIISTIPGMKLFHEGQFEGRKVRVPVFLSRRPAEHIDEDLHAFYSELLRVINRPVFREGRWKLCERSGWPDNESFWNLLAWTWTNDEERYLIVVNFGDSPAQALVRVDWSDARGVAWRLNDPLAGTSYERDGEALSAGLYVDLHPWNYHLFQCSQLEARHSVEPSAASFGAIAPRKVA
jgi:hypothetical protein